MTKRIVVIAVDLAVEYSRHRPLRVIHSPISLELMAGITPVGTSVPEDRERKHSGGTTTCDVACLWYATQCWPRPSASGPECVKTRSYLGCLRPAFLAKSIAQAFATISAGNAPERFETL